jgi:hypothetical protein
MVLGLTIAGTNGVQRKIFLGGKMSEFYVNLYRLLIAALGIFVFFVAGRPYFDAKLRVLTSAFCAGILNAFAGGASVGTSPGGLPLRFIVGFLLIGAGVALLEYVFPQGGRGRQQADRP